MASLPDASTAPEGAKHALANAERHLKCARLLAEAGEECVGCSHLVLALEEAQKAYVLALLAIGLSPEDVGVDRVMRHHETRHWMAFWDIFALANRDMMARQIERARLQFGDTATDLAGPAREAYIKGLETEIRDLTSQSPDTNRLLAAFEWMGTANERKNSGFYVDFRNGVWLTPERVLSNYSRGLDITREFVDLRTAGVEWLFNADAVLRRELLEAVQSAKALIETSGDRVPIAKIFRLIEQTL